MAILTLKIALLDFYSVSDHFGTLYFKGWNSWYYFNLNLEWDTFKASCKIVFIGLELISKIAVIIRSGMSMSYKDSKYILRT